MPKITALHSTWLKADNLAASDLRDSEKIYVKKGGSFFAERILPARNQHVLLQLASPMFAQEHETRLSAVFGYAPHFDMGDRHDELIKLNVKHDYQLDNDTRFFGPGWRQCNTTSNCMLADYLLNDWLSQQAEEEGLKEPESVYMKYVAKFGDTVDHAAQTKALRELGIDSYWSHSLNSHDLLTSLEKNIPVVIGFKYKSSGHICLLVGHNPVQKAWIVHDPYGTRHGSSDSYDVGVGGIFDLYSYETFDKIYWDQGREAGWGRIVTAIKGITTGMPAGL